MFRFGLTKILYSFHLLAPFSAFPYKSGNHKTLKCGSRFGFAFYHFLANEIGLWSDLILHLSSLSLAVSWNLGLSKVSRSTTKVFCLRFGVPCVWVGLFTLTHSIKWVHEHGAEHANSG